METKQGTYPSVVIDIEERQEERKKKRQEAIEQRRERIRWERDESGEQASSKRSGKSASVRLKRVVIVTVIAIVLVVVASQAKGIFDLKKQEAAAERELAAKQETQERLEKELALVGDPAYIEAQARERLRMIRPGEILYVLEEESTADQN